MYNGNDQKYTELSRNVKVFPLPYHSQTTIAFRLTPYEMVFNQKPRKPMMLTANSSKTHKVIVNQKRLNLLPPTTSTS